MITIKSAKKSSPNLKTELILRAGELQDLEITEPKVFEKAREVGAEIFLCPRLHAKFILVDESKAVVGSANLTDSGLSEIDSGNIEAGVYYDEKDDPQKIKELSEYFEKIKREYSVLLDDDIVGFLLSPVKTTSFEFIVLSPTLSEHEYVEVKTSNEKKILGKITSIYAYNTKFFANPFSSYQSSVFAPLDDFKRIFVEMLR